MLRLPLFAARATAAGVLIPIMALPDVRLGKTLGAAAQAPVLLFVVGLMAACTVSLLVTGGIHDLRLLRQARALDLASRLIMASYVFMVTYLAPRLGISAAILFAVSVQILTSAAIDHFGLLGASVWPASLVRLIRIALILAGLVMTQIGGGTGVAESLP
jgi:transporter family-2 protein